MVSTRPGRSDVMARRRLIVLSAAALVTTIAAVSVIVFLTPAFGVDRVDVHGVTFVDPDEVRAAAAIEIGMSIAAVDADEVARRVATLDPVKHVDVTRDWPHVIVIAVEERTPFLSVIEGDQYRLVDASGVAYRTVDDRPDGTVVARISEPGRADPATVAVVAVVSALTDELADVLVKVDGRAANAITLELSKGRTIFWGDASDSDRKAEVATALLDRSEKHLDVSAPDVPTVS